MDLLSFLREAFQLSAEHAKIHYEFWNGAPVVRSTEVIMPDGFIKRL
jgi:hypothetical protein